MLESNGPLSTAEEIQKIVTESREGRQGSTSGASQPAPKTPEQKESTGVDKCLSSKSMKSLKKNVSLIKKDDLAKIDGISPKIDRRASSPTSKSSKSSLEGHKISPKASDRMFSVGSEQDLKSRSIYELPVLEIEEIEGHPKHDKRKRQSMKEIMSSDNLKKFFDSKPKSSGKKYLAENPGRRLEINLHFCFLRKI